MLRLSDRSPIRLPDISNNGVSLCLSLAKTLKAEAYSVESITKSPEEIWRIVLERNGAGLKTSECRMLPSLILHPDYDQAPAEFTRVVIKNYAKGGRFWQRLFNSWLHNYNLASPSLDLALQELNRNINKLTPDAKGLAERYPILSKSPDFRKTALSLLNGKMSKDDRESLRVGTDGEITSKLAEAIVISCAQHLRSRDSTEEQILAFRDLVAPSGVIQDTAKVVAMVGLILGAAEHPSSDKLIKEVSGLIEKSFDDPVTEKHKWPFVPDVLGGNSVREKCLATVLKWQVFRSITLFFKIIEQVVESEHKHQFPIRRNFWLNYFNRGEINDAWVILGSRARERMIRLKNQNVEEFRALKWASLSGGPSDQCALLMKVGDTTVMEFSHSGKVRMWGKQDSGRGQIPVLHNRFYDASELRAECPTDQMFTHDPTGHWRLNVQRCLQKLAGGSAKL